MSGIPEVGEYSGRDLELIHADPFLLSRWKRLTSLRQQVESLHSASLQPPGYRSSADVDTAPASTSRFRRSNNTSQPRAAPAGVGLLGERQLAQTASLSEDITSLRHSVRSLQSSSAELSSWLQDVRADQRQVSALADHVSMEARSLRGKLDQRAAADAADARLAEAQQRLQALDARRSLARHGISAAPATAPAQAASAPEGSPTAPASEGSRVIGQLIRHISATSTSAPDSSGGSGGLSGGNTLPDGAAREGPRRLGSSEAPAGRRLSRVPRRPDNMFARLQIAAVPPPAATSAPGAEVAAPASSSGPAEADPGPLQPASALNRAVMGQYYADHLEMFDRRPPDPARPSGRTAGAASAAEERFQHAATLPVLPSGGHRAGEVCCICLEELQSPAGGEGRGGGGAPITLSCGHTHHRECLRTWVRKRGACLCPYCKQEAVANV